MILDLIPGIKFPIFLPGLNFDYPLFLETTVAMQYFASTPKSTNIPPLAAKSQISK